MLVLMLSGIQNLLPVKIEQKQDQQTVEHGLIAHDKHPKIR